MVRTGCHFCRLFAGDFPPAVLFSIKGASPKGAAIQVTAGAAQPLASAQGKGRSCQECVAMAKGTGKARFPLTERACQPCETSAHCTRPGREHPRAGRPSRPTQAHAPKGGTDESQHQRSSSRRHTALRDYVVTKLDRVTRHLDQVVDINVLLSVEKLREKDKRQKAEVTLHVKGRDIFVEHAHEDLYAAIDQLMDKLDRQVVRHKDRVQDHHHAASKRMDIGLN